jgi:Uma2 family endonuclease
MAAAKKKRKIQASEIVVSKRAEAVLSDLAAQTRANNARHAEFMAQHAKRMAQIEERSAWAEEGSASLEASELEPMDTERHRKQMNVLTGSLELAWHDRHDFYVGGNMAIYFSQLQMTKNDFRGPDVFVVLDTVRRERKSWVVWQEEGRTPDVVIELVSPATEDVDRGEKMHIYAKLLRVPHYYLFDPLTYVLEGYTLDAATGAYARMKAFPDGDLPCPRLGLRLGPRQGAYEGIDAAWLRWIDESGRVLSTSEEVAREEARLRAEAEGRLAEALAEIERLKGSRTSD